VDRSGRFVRAWSGSRGLQRSRHGLELRQGSGEVVDDLAGNDLRCREVIEVLERGVLQPGDVEVDLVPRNELVIAEGAESLALDPLAARAARLVVLDEVVEMAPTQRVLLEREVLVGAQVVDSQPLGPGLVGGRPLVEEVLVQVVHRHGGRRLAPPRGAASARPAAHRR
jgi:hypothetical protein